MSINAIKEILDEQIKLQQFAQYGITQLERPLTMDFYLEWIDQGYAGNMDYLKNHIPMKENPRAHFPFMKSAILFLAPYYPHPEPINNSPLSELRIAQYAQGVDYHFWFKNKMKKIIAVLQTNFPQEEFLCFTDSAPVLERDLARRAGLGWIGKNSCLLNREQGSLFFIGEIYTSIEFATKVELSHDFCGHCTRCIDICPTQALNHQRTMDARKCISYLTIESKELPAIELRKQMGDWFFGCDLCQTVCPWNQKVFQTKFDQQKAILSKSENEKKELIDQLRWLLQASNKQIQKQLFGTPLARATAKGLKRNALIVIANRQISELKNEVLKLAESAEFNELANWTLAKLEK